MAQIWNATGWMKNTLDNAGRSTTRTVVLLKQMRALIGDMYGEEGHEGKWEHDLVEDLDNRHLKPLMNDAKKIVPNLQRELRDEKHFLSMAAVFAHRRAHEIAEIVQKVENAGKIPAEVKPSLDVFKTELVAWLDSVHKGGAALSGVNP